MDFALSDGIHEKTSLEVLYNFAVFGCSDPSLLKESKEKSESYILTLAKSMVTSSIFLIFAFLNFTFIYGFYCDFHTLSSRRKGTMSTEQNICTQKFERNCLQNPIKPAMREQCFQYKNCMETFAHSFSSEIIFEVLASNFQIIFEKIGMVNIGFSLIAVSFVYYICSRK